MDRSPLYLAALASAAVPGLDPASVEALPSETHQLFDVAFIQDTQHRRWVIRAPRTQAAGAQMDVTVALLGLLARRLPFSVPTPKGFAPLKEGGRAAVYPYLPGQNIDFSALPPGPGLAAELGRTIAALHNADHQIFDEAGLPAYDPDTYRTRRLSELDRAAATGHVPTALLARWERALEDVSVWRFAPTPTHGDLTGDQVLAVFDDEQDASTGRIKALTGWEDAKVADPADDFAALVSQAPPEAFETVMEAYAHARVERPDKNLEKRARLAAEMHALADLMGAVSSGDRALIERHAAALRRLDDRLHAEEEAAHDYRRTSSSQPVHSEPVLVPPPMGADEDDDDVALMFAKTAPETENTDDENTDDENTDDGDANDGDANRVPQGATAAADESPEVAETGHSAGPTPEDVTVVPVAHAEQAVTEAEADTHADTGADAPSEAPAESDRGEGAAEPHQVVGAEPGPEFEPGFDARR